MAYMSRWRPTPVGEHGIASHVQGLAWPGRSMVPRISHEQQSPIRLNTTDKSAEAVSRFGAALKAKLSGKGAVGAPEDQLRAPFESLLGDMAEILLFAPGKVVAVGETTLSSLKTRPDYAVKIGDVLAGYVEVKAPGKGADPRAVQGRS